MAVAAEAMSEDERSQFERLTGTQKSAILMMLLESHACHYSAAYWPPTTRFRIFHLFAAEIERLLLSHTWRDYLCIGILYSGFRVS